MTLGQRIKECRQTSDITQKELAVELQITLQHMAAIEQDKRIPSLPLIIKLAEQLHASLDYLVLGKREKIDLVSYIQQDDDLEIEARKCLIKLIRIMHELKDRG